MTDIQECAVKYKGCEIKITIPTGATLAELLTLCEQAIRGLGFHFSGTLDIGGED